MKAFSYLRVSGKGQVEGDGFPRQRAAIAAWAKAHKAEIVDEFAEEGVSGEADWTDRPAFQDLVSRLLENGTRTVVVENLTRLARSFVIQDTLLTYLASRGITLISADTGEDVTAAVVADPMKRAIIQIQAVFAELEKNSLVRKLRAARQRKRKEGQRVEGRKPYGTRKGEEEVLERMRALRAEGLSCAGIAHALTKEGVPTRMGQKKKHAGQAWSPGTVYHILKRAAPVKKGRSRRGGISKPTGTPGSPAGSSSEEDGACPSCPHPPAGDGSPE